MTDPTRHLLFCTALLLGQGRTLDRLSRPITAAALIALLIYPAIIGPVRWAVVGPVVAVAIAGLAETCCAIRVQFDAELFSRLASASEGPDFTATDAALMQLGLLPSAKPGRPADARVAGAKRLFRFQILAVAAQVVCVLIGACTGLVGQ
jgi:hypothetical protein